MGRTLAVAMLLVVITVVVGAPSGFAGPLADRGCADAWTVVLQPPSMPGSDQLQGVDASSPADAWAVGSVFTDADQIGHTSTQHFDGTSWSFVSSPDGPSASTSALTAVSARAANDAWAVGLSIRTNNLVRTLIEHWDGTSWIRVKSPNAGHPANGQLNGVAAIAPDDVWAVGSSGQGAPSRTLIEHWDGSTWSIVASPNKGRFPNELSAVGVVAPDDIWAVGSWFTKGFVDRTLILHWDGTAWTRVPSPNADAAENDLVSVAAIATDDVWAVGFHGLHTLTMHWDGAAWTVVPSPTPGGSADLAGVVAIAPDEVWAVGGASTVKRTPSTPRWSIGTARAGPSSTARTKVRATTTSGARPLRAGTCSPSAIASATVEGPAQSPRSHSNAAARSALGNALQRDANPSQDEMPNLDRRTVGRLRNGRSGSFDGPVEIAARAGLHCRINGELRDREGERSLTVNSLDLPLDMESSMEVD